MTLPNSRHEIFAQASAKGETADAAYVLAGFKSNRGNAATLKRKEHIQKRIAEILQEEAAKDAQATKQAIDKLAITKERVLGELARIGFSDIRKIVQWGEGIAVIHPDTGDVAIANGVSLIASADLDDDSAAAIAEVTQTKDGLKVKMYDKKGALVDLGKAIGLFKDDKADGQNITINISGKDGAIL